MELAGWVPAVQGWTTVLASVGGPSCPTPVLSRNEACTDLTTLAELQAELSDPNAPHGLCSALEPGGMTDCPIDPETVRVVACHGVDGLCDESIGERCLSRCVTTSVTGTIANSNCQEREWVCARTVAGCDAPLVLADDARGCLPDVWDCSEPEPDTGAIDPSEIAQQVGSEDGSDLLEINQGDVKHTVPGYASLNDVHQCVPRPLTQFGDKTGITQEEAKATKPITQNGQGLFGDPLILGGDQFGLYAQPTLYHEFDLEVQHLDHLQLRSDAQGALIAGVKVFGFDVTVLDVDAHAFISQCGVDAAARMNVFGETVVGIPGVDSRDEDCSVLFETLNAKAAELREAAILARKLRERYDDDPALACEFMATVWGTVEVPWECASLGELDGVPQNNAGWGTVLTDAAITYYHSKVAEYLTLRQQYVALASATALSVDESAANAELFKTPFVSSTQEANVPIGPITLTLATSLAGSYGLKGGLFYTLDHGFDANGITTGDPKARGGVVVTPGLSVDGALYVGVGFGFGAIASASVGVEGQLTFLDVSVPIHAGVGISGRSFGDAEVGRDVMNSEWAGLPTGIPSDRVFSWELDWDFGARLKLQTLSGKLNAAARVRFLFYSKTFRKKLTEWEGPYVAFSLAETEPVNSTSPSAPPSSPDLKPFGAEGVNMGWQAETVAYTRANELDGAWTFTPSGADGLCKPRVPQAR